jgi:hypothetical protein
MMAGVEKIRILRMRVAHVFRIAPRVRTRSVQNTTPPPIAPTAPPPIAPARACQKEPSRGPRPNPTAPLPAFLGPVVAEVRPLCVTLAASGKHECVRDVSWSTRRSVSGQTGGFCPRERGPATGGRHAESALKYLSAWGYGPLLLSLAATREPLYVVNRPASVPSHDGVADWVERVLVLVEPVLVGGLSVPTFASAMVSILVFFPRRKRLRAP